MHVIMYGYYLLCVMGLRPKWKRLVTDCQIVQFVFGFVVSVFMLYYHFTGFGCSGIWGWCFNAVFNASILALFVHFYSKSYVLECNLCTNFALFTSFNIDILHLIIVIYLYFIFVGALLLIGAKIELQDDV